MAIAIVAFAVVSLVALLPGGLGQFRTALDATLSAQIAQRVMTDAEQSEFDQLLAKAETKNDDFYVLPMRYFDEQGSEVPSTPPNPPKPEDAIRIAYVVRVRGSMPGPANVTDPGSAFTSLPAGEGKKRFRPRASTILTVQVALNPTLRELAKDDDLLWKRDAAPMNTYTSMMTRTGYTRKKP